MAFQARRGEGVYPFFCGVAARFELALMTEQRANA